MSTSIRARKIHPANILRGVAIGLALVVLVFRFKNPSSFTWIAWSIFAWGFITHRAASRGLSESIGEMFLVAFSSAVPMAHFAAKTDGWSFDAILYGLFAAPLAVFGVGFLGALLSSASGSAISVLIPSREVSMVAHSDRVFAALSAVLPKRYVHEELGDALERLTAMEAGGVSHWKQNAYFLKTLFWITINVARDFLAIAAAIAKLW